MSVYCWGNTTHGELGLGGIEDEQIVTPREMTWNHAADLVQAACGATHTLLLTQSGKVYSCGNNDFGQLGHDQSRKRPQIIEALENYHITQISCGTSHSLAINEWGQIFSWGSNSCGQLGVEGIDRQPVPKLIRMLATKHIIQITSGQFFCLALTNSGELYSWGANSFGQLGLGTNIETLHKPTLITSLAGIPMAYITCGGNHCFALSKSGAVFGWGKNSFGQLGLNDVESRPFPTQLKTLRSIGVRYIACGDDFSIFLTNEGGVFSCGSGSYGQLGHGNYQNEIVPKMIVELMGSTISQITCGRRHTLALVPSRGRVYGFGVGGSGQLGNRVSMNASTPQVVIGPWVSPSGVALLEDANGEASSHKLEIDMIVKRIFSGGDHCFVALIAHSQKIAPDDCRMYDERTQILSLTLGTTENCAVVAKDVSVDLDLLSHIEIVFKSLSCMNGSFLLSNDAHYCCTSKHHGINMALAEEAFDNLRKMKNENLKSLIWDSITLELLNALIPSPADVETLRIYIILPFYHEFINSKNYLKLHSPFCSAVLKLQAIPLKIVSYWWSTINRETFERLIEIFKNVLSYIFQFQIKKPTTPNEKAKVVYEPNLAHTLNLMGIFFRINHQQRTIKVPYEIFHMPEINDVFDLRQDYFYWLTEWHQNNFHLCNYPFLFDAPAKTLLLQTDQAIQMHNAMQTAANQSIFMLFSGTPTAISQFIVLNVTRENIVEDTIRELAIYQASDLKKPLKIKFHGEEAEDAGGVRKEFFMLLLKDILDPKYGMFKSFEESRSLWFLENSFEDEQMYRLIGILCGLAIYNFTIINLPFPLALYKKILKEKVDITDLRDLSPVMANSMQSILDYKEADLKEVFNLTFEITRESFGETVAIPLKPDGDKIDVTLENKEEFVELYIDYILNKSVEKSFTGFYEGFTKVCGGKLFNLFQPHELMQVIIGNEEYDWHVWESATEYKNGYKSSDETILWFWEVFHELPLEEKKKFLLFLTGSDRIPIQGMKAIKLIIQPTTDDKFLPVAHTCFNLLDLPRYKTKEKLKYKLLQAIQQTQGFSLV